MVLRAGADVPASVSEPVVLVDYTGPTDAERYALRAADLVIVYGGADVVDAYRGRVPGETRLVVHGPRFSVGAVAREALGDLETTAFEVARAVATFDQRGCVSPHAVWVEAGPEGDATDFAAALADALEAVESELPRGRITDAEASAIQQERTAAELRGHAPDRPPTRVFAGPATRWTVIYDADPTFTPSCLNRLIRVHPVDDLAEVADLLAPVGRLLQSVAVAGPEARRVKLAGPLARVGATRITTFERLPWPPPEWHHDGQQPLRELLRWVDLES